MTDMYDKEKKKWKKENNREKYHPGVFLSLTMGGGNCGPKWR